MITATHPRLVSTSPEVVSNQLIHQCLALYKPEYVHLQDASYSQGELAASFRLYPLEFHRKPLDHLSRVQIVHYIGQSAFVLAGCMATDDLLAPMSLGEYLRQVESEACTFRRLKLQFRRYLPNEDGTKVVISCGRVHRRPQRLVLDMKFELNDGACFGDAHAVIPTGKHIYEL